jgi:Transposase DDE domain.
MYQSIRLLGFMQQLFDSIPMAEKAEQIVRAIFAARSPRLSQISQKMAGRPDANYKMIQRFLKVVDIKRILLRLFQEGASYVIGDVTEMPRPGARKTEYVGTLKDGGTKGFWLLTLATPYRGRALPCSFVTYSSKTIADTADSRNLNHFRAFAELKPLLGERPLILDREFSYLDLLLRLIDERVHFIIRLNLGSHPPKIYNAAGRQVELTVSPGETVLHNQVYYKGKARVNIIGTWKAGLREPMWVMTDLEAHQGLALYQERMKIEESFRDLKSLLHIDAVMNKTQANMEQMVALVMLAFTIGLLIGETTRDHLYAQPIEEGEAVSDDERIPDRPHFRKSRKWKLYSGLFLLLNRKLSLSASQLKALVRNALEAFIALVYPPVRSFV